MDITRKKTPYILVEFTRIKYVSGVIGTNIIAELKLGANPAEFFNLNSRNKEMLSQVLPSELEDLPLSSTIIERDEHQDESTLNNLYIPIGKYFNDKQKDALANGTVQPSLVQDQEFSYQQEVKEKRGNQYTTDKGIFEVTMQWSVQLSADYTDAERETALLGIDVINNGPGIVEDYDERISSFRKNELQDFAQVLVVRHGEGFPGKRLTYFDLANLIDELSNQTNLSDIEKAYTYDEVYQLRGRLFALNNEGINPNLIDPTVPRNSHKHILVPFTDGYHARVSREEFDFLIQQTPDLQPRWYNNANPEHVAWWNGMPAADSKSEQPGTISQAYRIVLARENIGPEDGPFGWLRGPLGNSLEDARASMNTIETFRAFRSGGFDAFATQWRIRMLE